MGYLDDSKTALMGEIVHQCAESGAGGAIQMRCRLIENQIRRIHRQYAGKRQTLLLAAGQPAHIALFKSVEAHGGKRGTNALACVILVQAKIAGAKSNFIKHER